MVVGSFGRKQGTRRILVENAKAKQQKDTRSLSTVIESLRNEHSGGGTSRGDGNEVVQSPCKGGKATETIRWQLNKTPLS